MKNDTPARLFQIISERACTALQLVLTFILVPTLLFFGLRSKDWPMENDVEWLPEQRAVRFHSPSMAYVDNLQIPPDEGAVEEFTLQFRVAVPDLEVKGFRPILTIYAATDERQLAVWHWGGSVIAMNGDDYDFSRRWPRIFADEVLRPDVPVTVTISSGRSGTRMYVENSLVREHGEQILSIPREGSTLRLILGNSVYGKHGWDGDFHLLAMFDGELTPEDIAAERQSCDAGARLCYAFDGAKGRVIPDLSGHGNDMFIPPAPVILKRTFLSTPWHDVYSRSFWLDALANLLGFIPLGAVVYSLLRRLQGLRYGHAAVAAALSGFLLSLTIELIQVWLPARASSLLDLTLNTVGTVAGIAIMCFLFGWQKRKQDSNALLA